MRLARADMQHTLKTSANKDIERTLFETPKEPIDAKTETP